MKIAIRTDASLEIGTGHIMRCLTLAEELRERGVEITFISREHPGHLCELVESKGFKMARLCLANTFGVGDEARVWTSDAPTEPPHAHWLGVDWQTDAEQTIEILKKDAPWDWLVVDHYALDARWETAIRPWVGKIMVIDDLADRPHDCELLLDQNLYEEMESRYEGLVPPNCRQLLGPKYALLRREFRETRKNLRERDGTIRRVLVFFGGVDSQNMTGKALEAIARLNQPDIAVDVVIGGSNPNHTNIEATSKNIPNVSLYVQASNMAELMSRSDLAIGAGGTATWERCCLGLPTLACPIAEHQTRLLQDTAKMGMIYAPTVDNSTVENLAIHLRALLQNPILCSHMSRESLRASDGEGARRVSMLLTRPPVHLRQITPEDTQNLFEWRNDLWVRRFSRNSEPIAWEQHVAWIEGVMSDPNRWLLIGIVGDEPVGVLRFDIMGNEAEISVYLVPGKQGQGLGAAVIEAGECWLKKNCPEVSTLLAEVLAENAASDKLFRECGYSPSATRYQKRLI